MKNELSPLVSIIIPVYNSEKTVERAISSALSQTYPNIEVIAVDDASSDGSLAKMAEFKDSVRIIAHEKNQNGSAARNTGASVARGEFLAFLDADDEFLPNKIERQVGRFFELTDEKQSLVATICSSSVSAIQKTKPRFVSLAEVLTRSFDENSSCIFVLKSTFDSIGGFDQTFTRHQDLEFMARLTKEGKVDYWPEYLVARHHSGSPSFKSTQKGIYNFWRVFREDINSLSKEDRSIVYGLGNRRLAELAYNERKWLTFTRYLFLSFLIKPSFVVSKIPYYLKKLGSK